MKKRLLSGLLVCAMALSMAPTAFATTSTTEAAQVLAALDIMVGDENGNLNLDQQVTRAQFSKMSVASTIYGDYVGDTVSISPYPDVSKDNWAAPWISTAVDLGLVKGNLYGYFEPDRSITLAEGVTIVLRLLGYEDSAFTGVWPAGQMAQYRALDLDEGIICGQDEAMDRQDAMYLFYNMMTTPTATGSGYYLNTVEPGLVDANGDIDLVALINSAMSGPVVAEAGWTSKVPFSTSEATVYRNGALSSLNALTTLDVVYWSESMKTIWAYSDYVTGTYDAVSPTSSAPSAVTVAGKTYAIETTSAAYALSDLGEYRVGDTVTLLLGRDGNVAAVRSSAQSSATMYGMVLSNTVSSYTDASGQAYSTYAVTLRATDGSDYTYAVADDTLEAGTLVRVTSGTSGIEVSKMTVSSLTGKVNSAGTTFAGYTFADNVQILDVYEDTGAVRVYPSRIAGVSFTDRMVQFYALNEQGEISHMILDDVTGDCHSYGVLTSASETNVSMVVMGVYVADISGQVVSTVTENTIYGVSRGPCMLEGGAANIEMIYNLDSVSLQSVSGNTATTNANRSLTISDSVAVYEVRDNEYFLTTLERVSSGDYTLTGYYDKDQSEGGRIRVILAK